MTLYREEVTLYREEVTLYVNLSWIMAYGEMPAVCPPDLGRPRCSCMARASLPSSPFGTPHHPTPPPQCESSPRREIRRHFAVTFARKEINIQCHHRQCHHRHSAFASRREGKRAEISVPGRPGICKRAFISTEPESRPARNAIFGVRHLWGPPSLGRVDLGGCPPRSPTDPGLHITPTRFLIS